MHYITLDTNTWIYLANGTEPVRLLSYLKREVNKGNITILLPEIIVSEWQKNKEAAVTQGALKYYKEASDAFDKILKLLGEKGEKDILNFLVTDNKSDEYFIDFVRKFKSRKTEIEKSIAENIELIETIFESQRTIKIPISDNIKLKSFECAVQKKAPCCKNKNSIADATIIFSFIDYITKNGIKGALFVSYNTEDFCEIIDGKKSLHKDLKPLFKEAHCSFYSIVGEAINTIRKDIVTKEEIELIREFQGDAMETNPINEIETGVCEYCLKKNEQYQIISFLQTTKVVDERSLAEINSMQLSLGYHDRYIKKPSIKTFDKLIIAFCEQCGTEHFICPRCGETNDMSSNEYNKPKECIGCGLTFQVERTSLEIKDTIRYKILKPL